MIPIPSGVQVWLATGYTDMRKGLDGLALIVQETLKRDPHNGHLFVFRGRRGCLIRIGAVAGHRGLRARPVS
jgi:transposase